MSTIPDRWDIPPRVDDFFCCDSYRGRAFSLLRLVINVNQALHYPRANAFITSFGVQNSSDTDEIAQVTRQVPTVVTSVHGLQARHLSQAY